MSARRTRRVARTIGEAEGRSLDNDYRAHSDWLRSLARRRTGCPHAAEDLVQEAYVRVSRYPAEARHRPRPLLRRILGNLISDRFRAKARENAGVASLEASLGERPFDEANQAEIIALKDIISSMPDPLRDVFLRPFPVVPRLDHRATTRLAIRSRGNETIEADVNFIAVPATPNAFRVAVWWKSDAQLAKSIDLSSRPINSTAFQHSSLIKVFPYFARHRPGQPGLQNGQAREGWGEALPS